MTNFVDENSDEITLSSLIPGVEPREWGCIFPIIYSDKTNVVLNVI